MSIESKHATNALYESENKALDEQKEGSDSTSAQVALQAYKKDKTYPAALNGWKMNHGNENPGPD